MNFNFLLGVNKKMYSTPKKVLKIIVAGNGGIGKTTLMKSFCYREYAEDQRLTVGTEIFIKKFVVDDQVEFMQVWDLGGQEHFRFFLKGLVKGAHGAILGFDIKRRNSFIDLKKWLALLRSADPDIPIVLVATKLDLGYHPTLTPELARKFVEENNLIGFVEISSKEKYNLEVPFRVLITNRFGCTDEKIPKFLDYELETNHKGIKSVS